MPTINLATLRVKLTADNAEYQEKITESKTKTQDHGKVFETAIAGAAVAAFAVAAKAAVDFARESSKEFQQFDKQAREVFTLMPGMSTRAMDAMSDDVLDFSAEVGRVSDEVVPALYQAISAGQADDPFGFLRVASDVAAGGVTELETAVDGLSSVINAYGAENISATQAADLLFTAVRGGKTTIDDLSRSLFQVNPTAAALGLEFGNVTAALAALTSQGVPTAVATTQLRQLLIELSKEGGATAATFERVAGQSFVEFIAQGGNLQGALDLMSQAAGDGNVRLSDMFSSVEAAGAAMALTGAGAAKFAQELQAAANASGATEEAAAIMNDSLEHQEALAAAAKEEMMILIGEGLEPAKRAWLELQTAIAQTAVESLKTGAVEDDLRGQFEALGFAGADLEMRIVAARMATTELGNEQIGSEKQAARMARAVEILSGAFDGNVDALNDLITTQMDMEAQDAIRLEQYQLMYEMQNGLLTLTEEQTAANETAIETVSRLALSEQLHALDISNAAQQHEINAAAVEADRVAHELFVADFERYTAVIDAARGPVGDLEQAQRDLTAASGEWVTTVADGSGEIITYYTGDARAAEDAQARIDAANAAISASYRQTALDIAMVKLSEQYGEDALAAQEAYLKMAVAMGTLTQEEADKLLDVATKTDAVTTATTAMMDKYLSDGDLTTQEAEKIATAVALIETHTDDSRDATDRLADEGGENLRAVRKGAADTGQAFFDAIGDVEAVGLAVSKLPNEKTIDVYVNVHGDIPNPDTPAGRGTPSRGGDNEFAAGGFTGFGATADIAGVVHHGEYVFNATAVDSLGIDTLDAMHSIAQMGGVPAVGMPADGGDITNTYHIYNQTREAAALTMAQIYQEKRARLDAYMGV